MLILLVISSSKFDVRRSAFSVRCWILGIGYRALGTGSRGISAEFTSNYHENMHQTEICGFRLINLLLACHTL
jgi:hypothetical protein